MRVGNDEIDGEALDASNRAGERITWPGLATLNAGRHWTTSSSSISSASTTFSLQESPVGEDEEKAGERG
ncbi:MAG: hypothetical protein J6Z49_05620 [Kiritimatiellae bacterium]|nr:hypothetical protein [Kiritimatiellia bacterium]